MSVHLFGVREAERLPVACCLLVASCHQNLVVEEGAFSLDTHGFLLKQEGVSPVYVGRAWRKRTLPALMVFVGGGTLP